MKISTNWLKDYIDLGGVDLKDLANKITNTGVNVEGISAGLDTNNLVVGEVVECTEHPNSDHLHVCRVNIGTETLQIVCGAPNVRVGLKVIVALVGAVLPGDFEIKKSVIRGTESFGMLCALSELGLEDEIEGGIHELPSNAKTGNNPLEYLNGNNDIVYTLDLNPNRNDCLSHLGFAYEAAASLNVKVKTPDITHKETNENVNDLFKLKVDTENCSLMLLKLVKNVSIGESPKFIQDRLISAGMRPINNAVDISNYVMLEYGQPLHFYDADKLSGVIGVRMSSSDEVIKTIDERDRLMSPEDIVITNGSDAIGIAGVMGGYSTEVDENTKNILIESAIFNPLLIRKTSIRLDLRSEASLRFEKGLNHEYTYESIERACNLLEHFASGEVCKGTLKYDKIDSSPKVAEVNVEEINNLLGLNLTIEDVKSSFDALDFEYTGEFKVTIPNRRMDVSIKEDLIEEVGRMYGFHKIEGSRPVQVLKKGAYAPRIKFRKDISFRLRSLGLNEVKTYTLVSESDATKFNYENNNVVLLDRPISKDRTHIRTSLIPSLLEVNSYNLSHSVTNVNVYEIANTYYEKNGEYKEIMKLGILLNGKLVDNSWNSEGLKVDFYLLKGIIENLIHYLGLDNRCKYDNKEIPAFMHPGVSASIRIDGELVGFFGKINPGVNKKELYVCEINLDALMNKRVGKLKFTEPNKYPSVKRDAAFIVGLQVNSSDIVKDIMSTDKSITECTVFDEYIMEDKKSLAFAMKFENQEHTLNEDEVNELFRKIIQKICEKYNAILRDK